MKISVSTTSPLFNNVVKLCKLDGMPFVVGDGFITVTINKLDAKTPVWAAVIAQLGGQK